MNDNFNLTYKALFHQYYPSLIFYASRLAGDEEAEDVVQDVLVELWKRKDSVEIGRQIQTFLYRAVYTRCLNVLNVRLEGETYFEVTRKPQQPFIVESDAMRVRVLGTTFNFKSEKGCRVAKATLIEGEIEHRIGIEILAELDTYPIQDCRKQYLYFSRKLA